MGAAHRTAFACFSDRYESSGDAVRVRLSAGAPWWVCGGDKDARHLPISASSIDRKQSKTAVWPEVEMAFMWAALPRSEFAAEGCRTEPCAANAADQVTEGQRRGRANDRQTAIGAIKGLGPQVNTIVILYVVR